MRETEMSSARIPHFIEIFDPSSSSERLKIPSLFVAKMEAGTSGTASLMGPSGCTWHADLIHHDDNLFLYHGWNTFVQDNFIAFGDALIFRYDGNLHFTVQIFDQSSCEKEAAFSAECSQNYSHYDKLTGKRRENKNEGSYLDCILEHVPKRSRGSVPHPVCLSNSQEEGCKENGVTSTTETLQFSMHANETGSHIISSVNTVSLAMSAQSKFSLDSLGTNINTGGNMERTARGSMLTSSDAEGLAQSFSSYYPSFRKTMRRSNISGSFTLNIPYQFSMAHLPNCKLKVVLQNLKGQSWKVNSIPTLKVHTSHTLCGGWLAFSRDNNINLGDICIFELLRQYELRVYILRVGKEERDCQGKTEVPHRKFSDCEAKGISWVSENSSAFGKQISLQDKQNSYAKGCISIKSVPEEKKAAQSFTSSYPHFVRIMKKFNISGSYTLKIPYQFSMEHLPGCKVEIVLRNLRGQSWTVNSIPSMRVQTLHTFCGGWMAFVRGNVLQIGDICIFELVDRHEMRVHIWRFGTEVMDYQSEKLGAPNELTLG
ncbi:B3 domain-containing protein Os11g0197600-like isoform X2 [Impatiens glandulifera]|uniref:B3 domain-containing protein Os11g0197600-like isoform X2 n=1 Tax=Impatiens glandulifera TaxID=253017 RepID=UPI001FB145FA|nr:B3 domain-containing protein Os11g0197600-like isoform X2 [Impatiens glandulifera]